MAAAVFGVGEGVPVDLAVRMGQRDTDFHPAVLEAEDLLDPGLCRQCGGAIGPCLDDRPHPRGGQR